MWESLFTVLLLFLCGEGPPNGIFGELLGLGETRWVSFYGASVNMVTMGEIGGGGVLGLGKDLLDYTMCWKIVDKLRVIFLREL